MEEHLITETPAYPSNLNTFAIPNDSALRRIYHVYKPSTQTLRLLSEEDRTIYPEIFIENSRLGPLKDLCTVVLARSFGVHPLPIVAENPMLLKVHYDALDVELPLVKCCDVTEESFWKRVVLAKHQDKTLAIKPNVNWKNLGVSLKYVELVEECPVEYWPAEEMKELALKVKESVNEMHIKHLKSLKDRAFEKNFQTESEDSASEEDSSAERDSESLLTTSGEEEIEAGDTEAKAKRKKERQALREAKQKARETKAAKRKRHEAERADEEEPKKKTPQKIPDNIFDFEISESEDDGEDRIVDKRNKALLLRHIKKYNYPANDCHHIDLKFVQYFTNLCTFTIEFWGPLQGRNFHKRHMQFSYDDINNLSIGLSHLAQLKTFRLRNSCMDAEKLRTLCGALGSLSCLETLDFGHDQLKDDCGLVFEELFEITKSLRNLELESNYLGVQVLQQIGKALKNYNVNELSYLGLARNPITDKALHALVSAVIGTQHIEHLNIRGAKFLTDAGLCCCLANELLRKHPTLIRIDICALKISPLTADEIMKSLVKNEKLLEFYCCGCELDKETEVEINVIMKRNKFILENSYLGDRSMTNEEIRKWLNRTRNPILLKVLAEKETNKQCLENRSEVSTPLSHINSLDIKSQMYETQFPENSCPKMQLATTATQRFLYPADDFDEQQFLEHVYQPGPQERYYYFKTHKQKYLIKDNVKTKFV